MKSNAGNSKPDNHSGSAPHHNLSSPDLVNVFECEEREDEVGARDDEPDGSGFVESNLFEEGSRVIYEGVKSTELLEGLHATSDNCM